MGRGTAHSEGGGWIYLSRLTADPQEIANRTLGHSNDGYRLHQAVWDAFADKPDRDRDFLYRVDDERPIRIYTLSARKPNPDSIWRIETKDYSPVIHKGDRFTFRVRVNPVIARKRPGQRSQRHDVVMDLKHRLRSDASRNGDHFPTQQEIVEEAGRTWLTKRSTAAGFEVVPGQIHTENYRQHQLKKPKSDKSVMLSSIDYHGLLTVSDPDAFRKVLFNGIGPAKGFGMGLMLLRRI